MGFERTVTTYQCGCYSEFYTHDSFFYTDPSRGGFYNVCGYHDHEQSAQHDDLKKPDVKVRILKEAEYLLVNQMNPAPVIKYLREENRLTKDEVDRLYKYDSRLELIKELLQLFIKNSNKTLFILRMAFIKTGQWKLVKHVKNPVESDIAIFGGDDERGMINLHGDCYVVANDYKGTVYIHIRNYGNVGLKKYPTKQGVSLNISRWLLLQQNEKEIDGELRKGIERVLFKEKRIHLGGGVYVTLNPRYPTVDIRHFWKPLDSNKAVPTKRCVALNKTKWNTLRSVFGMMTDFVPELINGVICSHDNENGMLECEECNPFHDRNEEKDDENTCPLSPKNQEGLLEVATEML